MIYKLIKISTICSLLMLLSCGEETPELPAGKYDSGVFVVNQGSFGSGTGTVDFFDRDTTLYADIYQSENAGSVLGNIAQSMLVVNDKAYIAINNAQKIEVVDASDFTSISTIQGMPQVRYMVSSEDGERLFASSWGEDGFSGVLYEIDTATDQIVSSHELGGGLENMVVDGQNIYIAKSGGFGTDSLVLRYDLATNELAEEYTVGDNPVGVVMANNGDIIILCSGAFDFSNPDNNTPGGIYRLSNNQTELIVETANGSANLAIDRVGNNVYYRDGEGIKQVILSTSSTNLVIPGGFFGLGFDPVDEYIYTANAKDFASDGEVVIYSKNGQEIRRFNSGIIPGEFYFR